jgi:phosphoserine phosphatase RsbU/P
MDAAPGQNLNPDWKEFLRLGEELLKQPTAADQCQVIIKTVQHLIQSKAEIWLAQPFYPLPGEPEINTLPSPAASQLVQKTYRERQQCCESVQGAAVDECSVQDQPCRVAVPLITQGSMLGILQVEREGQGFFTQADLDFLEGLAANAALSLQISRQVAIKNWRLNQLALVRSVSAQIANLLDLDELCERVTRLIQQTFNYYYVGIFTLDEEGGAPHFRACASQTGISEQKAVFTIQPGEGIVGFVSQNGVEVLAPHVMQEPRYRYLDSLPETQSEFALPLKVENRILGVLDVQSDQADTFHEIDQLVLHALADSIAIAVEGARLYSTVQRRADQINAVFEVSHALSSILVNLDELLEQVVHTIHQRFGYPYVHLFTVHYGRRMVIYRTGSGERSQAYRESSLNYDVDDPTGIIPFVARTGQTLLANDVSKEPHYRPNDLPPFETNSELTIPILFGDEVLGVLDIQSDAPHAFDQHDRSLLESLSASIAVALRNATLYRSEQWRRQVADSFRDVASLLPSNIALEDLLDKVLVALEGNLPCEASAIWLVDDSGQKKGKTLRLAASRGVAAAEVIRVRQRSLTVREWLDQALYKNEPTIRKPGDSYGPLGAALNFPEDYSSIACPLHAGNKVLGVLTLAHRAPSRYGGEARDMTATFANYAAVAIQNARLFSESQEQAWISTVLLQVAEANQSVSTLDELFANTIRLLPMLVGVKKAAVFLWEERQGAFVLGETYGMHAPPKGSLFFEKDAPALARLMAVKSILTIQNPVLELNLPNAALPDDHSTLILLPLLSRTELMGALLVAHQPAQAASEDGINAKTLSILQGIARQTAIAVENIHLVEARQEEAYVTAVLLQVAQTVVSENNLNDILDTIVHLMPILVGMDACIIYLWDKSNRVFIPTQAFSGHHQQQREMLSRSYSAGEFTLLDEVRQHDTFILCPLSDANLPASDWAELPCLPPGSMPTADMASLGAWLFGVPLSVKGEVYGVLLTKENSEMAVFRERRLEIITGVAQEVALAIQNEQLQQEMVVRERMEREIQLAREIQRTFLPNRLPQPPGWEIDARWQTARQVGGDFYDLFKLSEKRLGMVIADVADKGMPAALYMTVTRTLIRATVHNLHSPARVLERVNNLLIPDAQNGMFVTAVFAILSLETGQLIYANAGHNRPLLLRANLGIVEQLPKGGMALGVEEKTPQHDEIIQLNPQDCLILYTDGVTEAFSAEGETFGEDRLKVVLASSNGKNAQSVLNTIDHALTAFRGGEPLSDDVTLLAVHRQGPVL